MSGAAAEAQRRGRGAERSVAELARALGWFVAHVSDSRKPIRLQNGQVIAVGDKGFKGFPDFVFCHPRHGRFLIREVKTGKARTTPEQRAWLEALAQAGVDAGVWRIPEDWPLIEATLKGGAAPTGGGLTRLTGVSRTAAPPDPIRVQHYPAIARGDFEVDL